MNAGSVTSGEDCAYKVEEECRFIIANDLYQTAVESRFLAFSGRLYAKISIPSKRRSVMVLLQSSRPQDVEHRTQVKLDRRHWAALLGDEESAGGPVDIAAVIEVYVGAPAHMKEASRCRCDVSLSCFLSPRCLLELRSLLEEKMLQAHCVNVGEALQLEVDTPISSQVDTFIATIASLADSTHGGLSYALITDKTRVHISLSGACKYLGTSRFRGRVLEFRCSLSQAVKTVSGLVRTNEVFVDLKYLLSNEWSELLSHLEQILCRTSSFGVYIVNYTADCADKLSALVSAFSANLVFIATCFEAADSIEQPEKYALMRHAMVRDAQDARAVMRKAHSFAPSISASKEPSLEIVGGMKLPKQVLLRNIQEMQSAGGTIRSTILYGPPGTGKTFLVKSISAELRFAFVYVNGPELLDMYIGKSEANIREKFAHARAHSPSILFLDEIDSIAAGRAGPSDSDAISNRLSLQLAAEIDKNDHLNSRVYVIGATNRLDLVDATLLRSGRFDQALLVDVPRSSEERGAIIQAVFKSFNDEKLASVAERVPEAATPAEIRGIFMAAKMADSRAFFKGREMRFSWPRARQLLFSFNNRSRFYTINSSVSPKSTAFANNPQWSRFRQAFASDLSQLVSSNDQTALYECMNSAVQRFLVEGEGDFDVAEELLASVLLQVPSFDTSGEILAFFIVESLRERGVQKTIGSLLSLLAKRPAETTARLTPFVIELCVERAVEERCVSIGDLLDKTKDVIKAVRIDFDEIVREIYLPGLVWDRITELAKEGLLSSESYTDIFDTVLQACPSEQGAVHALEERNARKYARLSKLLSDWMSGGVDVKKEGIASALESCTVYLHYPPPAEFLAFIKLLK